MNSISQFLAKKFATLFHSNITHPYHSNFISLSHYNHPLHPKIFHFHEYPTRRNSTRNFIATKKKKEINKSRGTLFKNTSTYYRYTILYFLPPCSNWGARLCRATGVFLERKMDRLYRARDRKVSLPIRPSYRYFCLLLAPIFLFSKPRQPYPFSRRFIRRATRGMAAHNKWRKSITFGKITSQV